MFIIKTTAHCEVKLKMYRNCSIERGKVKKDAFEYLNKILRIRKISLKTKMRVFKSNVISIRNIWQ